MSLESLAEVMKYHTEETFDESEHKRNTSGEFSKKRGSVRGSRKPSRARGGKKSLNKLDGKVNRFGRKVSISGSSREESLEETHKKVLAVDPEKFKDALLDYDPDNDEQRAKMDSVFLFPDGDLKIGTDGDIDHDLTMGTTFDGIMGAKLMDELESGASDDDNIFTKYCNKHDIVRITSFGNSIGLEGNKMTEDQRQSLSRMMRSGKYQSISFEGNTKDGISDLVIDRWTNKALTDVNKLEISDHWNYINQIGREWYLKRTRQDENNSVRAWDEMNHDVKSKIGRMMNEARHKKTSGRYTQGYVDNDVNIGLNRYGTMIEGILRNLTPEDRESIADLRRHVVAKLQEIYPKDDYLGFDERIARKTVDKIMGVNIKKSIDNEDSMQSVTEFDITDKAQLGTFGTILAGVLIGLGGYATVKTIKGVMSKQGYDPSFLTTAIGSVVGSGLLVGGTKKIFNLKKGITFITVKKEIEHMSSMIPTYASDEGFHGGHEVITTDGEQGVIISLKGQYVDIRQKSGKISHVHVNNLIKADEVIVTKDGATRWGLMDYGQRRDLLKAKNLPETLSYKHWSQLDKNLHNIILKTSHDEDEDEAELSLEEKAVCPHCGKSDCECSTNKGDQIKTKPETPEKITESAEKGGYDKRTKLFKTGGKSVPELVKAILQSKKKA